MPLPFLIIGAAAAATAVGGKKAYDGFKNKEEAEAMISKAQQDYKRHKEHLDQANQNVSTRLEDLGTLELKIGADFAKFDKLVEDILKNNNFQKFGNTKVNIPQHKLNQIKEVAIGATDYLKTTIGGSVAGAATGYAVYGGVMALGAASTGTSIASLSGVAAYNATMAAIGGGSLAAGGWGMAGGAMVLGGAVVAPVLAVAGIAYAIHGSKALENANDVRRQVDDAVEKMIKAKAQLVNVANYAYRIRGSLDSIYKIFSQYLQHLNDVNEIVKQGDIEKIQNMSDEINLSIQNGISLAAIMAKLISTPLFKVTTKKNVDGKILTNKYGVPEIGIETDINGMQVLNDDLDKAILTSQEDFRAFKDISDNSKPSVYYENDSISVVEFKGKVTAFVKPITDIKELMIQGIYYNILIENLDEIRIIQSKLTKKIEVIIFLDGFDLTEVPEVMLLRPLNGSKGQGISKIKTTVNGEIHIIS